MDEKEKKIQCHFISNTHWDREWRFSARRTQYMLGYMLDMLLDILDKNPDYKHFHLDSQTMPVQDYLEVYPEKKEKLIKYIQEGRIAVGPWFCLPDEFTVGSEALIRNEKFPTRVYGELTLDCGYYDALIINLGSGKGDNWWCVVYPPLCFTGEGQNYVYKSKIHEIIKRFYEKQGGKNEKSD